MLPKDPLLLARAIIPLIEDEWACRIVLDAKVLEECFLRAGLTIGNIEIGSPNHFKQAGHYGFWVRKLKPLRLVDTDEFCVLFDYLITQEIITGGTVEIRRHVKKLPRSKFLNEVFAILVAIGIVRSFGIGIQASKEFINDLAANLRYHSFSPSAFAAILEAKATGPG